MTSENTIDLDTIKARIPSVYDGPWYVHGDDNGRWLVGYPTDNPLAGLVATVPDYGERLAEFIAHAREDLPALLAEVERLTVELGEARDEERKRFVAWLREHAGDTNCLDDCELFTEYAEMIERGEFDGLAASND